MEKDKVLEEKFRVWKLQTEAMAKHAEGDPELQTRMIVFFHGIMPATMTISTPLFEWTMLFRMGLLKLLKQKDVGSPYDPSKSQDG